MDSKQLAELLCEWAKKKKIQNEDFHNLFIYELLEMLEDDE
jgi:hypothetical protein